MYVNLFRLNLRLNIVNYFSRLKPPFSLSLSLPLHPSLCTSPKPYRHKIIKLDPHEKCKKSNLPPRRSPSLNKNGTLILASRVSGWYDRTHEEIVSLENTHSARHARSIADSRRNFVRKTVARSKPSLGSARTDRIIDKYLSAVERQPARRPEWELTKTWLGVDAMRHGAAPRDDSG